MWPTFHGHVTAFELLGSNGGLARYGLVIEPWLALLRQRVDSYAFQDKSVVEIIEDVFADYAEAGALVPAWRWELRDRSVYPKRSLTTQYAESDFDFVQRLLAEEGIAYWFEHAGDPSSETRGTHTLVLADHNEAFADSGRIRYHRADATEAEDSIQLWRSTRRAQTARLSRASWDYRSLGLRPATAEGDDVSGMGVEDDDIAGPYAWHDSADGVRKARQQLEAQQVQARTFEGEGSWRGLGAGAQFELAQHPDHSGDQAQFTCLQVWHEARNNLGAGIVERSEAELGAALPPPLLAQALQGIGSPGALQLASFGQADASSAGSNLDFGEGFYRNRFEAISAATPYRPQTVDGHGRRRHPRPTVIGTQTAIVVGDGGPVLTDRDHRIKVQFHWQRGGNASSGQAHPAGDDNAPANEASWTWVRVATPWAGDNWGGVLVPRVGQEVVVAFLEGDIDRPVVVGSVYNGVGNEDAAHNRIGNGAANATGNAPAWFEGNEHAAVYAGLKSQALADSQGGSGGYQQLRLDDTPGQGRAQASTTQQQTTLTLGHLKGGQDNVRGAERGFGAELSTQASGALRAGQGLLLTTEPGGPQLAAPMAHQQLGQSEQLLQSLADVAKTQQAQLEGDPDELPAQASLKSLQETLQATQSGSAPGNGIEGGEGEVPGWSAPAIVGSSAAGIASVTPADQVWVSGTQTVLSADRDLNWLSQSETVMLVAEGAVLFTHGGEAPADKPHKERGIALHAAQGKVSARAHKNVAKVAAKTSVTIASTQADIDVDAKKHVLLTAQGAYLKLEGGDIELGAPGTIEFKATKKELLGPENVMLELPSLPEASLAQSQKPIKFDISLKDVPGPSGYPLADTPWKIVKSMGRPQGMALIAEDDVILQGETDAQGNVKIDDADQELLAREYRHGPGRIWLMYPGQAVKLSVVEERDDWSDEDRAVAAMSAAGFSPDARSYMANTRAVGEIEYAMESLGEASDAGLVKKLDA
ncbi:type VI secretion system Vgr family protein [Luteimonas sp. A501]